MDFSSMSNMFQSAIRANNELLNMDKEVEQQISYKQLEEIKSIAENAKQQLVIMQKKIEFMENKWKITKKKMKILKSNLVFP